MPWKNSFQILNLLFLFVFENFSKSLKTGAILYTIYFLLAYSRLAFWFIYLFILAPD